MRAAALLPTIAFLAACSPRDSQGTAALFTTSFTERADTLVASTIGDIPDSLVHRLVVAWSVRTDTAREIIGDVHGVAVAADDRVWVWDNTTPSLWLLDADGRAMRQVGQRGSGPGEYGRANGIGVTRDGSLVMWDVGNARLNFFSADGTHRQSTRLAFTECCGLPITVDTLDRIWLTTHPRTLTGGARAVGPAQLIGDEVGYVRFAGSGALLDTVMAPTLPGADGVVSALVVSSTGSGGAIRRVPYGTYPTYAVSPLGHIVSALSRPFAVHSERNGRPLLITRDFAPPPISDDERAQIRANIEFVMKEVRADFSWNGPEVPRSKPPISSLAVGLDGRLWVRLSSPSEEYEPDPAAGGPTHRPPPVKFRGRDNLWDVFTPDGQYLGRIAAPRNVGVFAMRGNHAWGVVRDENDISQVARFRIVPGF